MDNNTFPQAPNPAPAPDAAPAPTLEPAPIESSSPVEPAPVAEPVSTPEPVPAAEPTPMPTPSEPTAEPAPTQGPIVEPTPAPVANETIGSSINMPAEEQKKKAAFNFKSPLFFGIIGGAVALIAAIIILVVILNQNPLTGTWKLVKYESGGEEEDISKMDLEFTTTSGNEGKYKSKYGDTTTEYSFLYNKDHIVAYSDTSEYGSATAFKYEIKDGQLIITPTNSSSYKVYLKKK